MNVEIWKQNLVKSQMHENLSLCTVFFYHSYKTFIYARIELPRLTQEFKVGYVKSVGLTSAIYLFECETFHKIDKNLS